MRASHPSLVREIHGRPGRSLPGGIVVTASSHPSFLSQNKDFSLKPLFFKILFERFSFFRLSGDDPDGDCSLPSQRMRLAL